MLTVHPSRAKDLPTEQKLLTAPRVSPRLSGHVRQCLHSDHGAYGLSGVQGGNVDLDLHPEVGVSISPINAAERNCLIGISRHGNPDEITVSHNTVGRIKFDPPGTGQVHLAPRMGGTAAEPPWAIPARNIDVSSHKTRGEPH
jgi:hypothetical protein